MFNICGGKSAKIAAIMSENERFINSAIINKEKKNFGVAIEDYNNAINQIETSKYKEDDAVKKLLGENYKMKGVLQEEQGQLTDSLESYRKAISSGNERAIDDMIRCQGRTQNQVNKSVDNKGSAAPVPLTPVEQINQQACKDNEQHQQQMAHNLATNTNGFLTRQAQGNYLANSADNAIASEQQALSGELMDNQQRKFIEEQMEGKKNLLSDVQKERSALTGA